MSAQTPVPFICYGGNFVPRQPYDIRGVTGYGFAANADLSKIQALCDKTLNFRNAAPFYKAISPTVLFTFMKMDRLSSADPMDMNKGSYCETELNLTILLAAGTWVGGFFVPERVVWHMPYLWLDSGTPMIAGRDFYGYPKQYGTISMPGAEGDPAAFQVTAEVLSRFGPGSRSSTEPIVEVRRTDGIALQHAAGWSGLEEAARAFVTAALTLDLADLIAGAFVEALTLHHLLSLVFLRQLASIADGSQACYQSVAEAPFEVTRFGSAGLLEGGFAIDIMKHDSAPIAAELGFAATNPAGDAHVIPSIGYFMDFDFRLDAGQEIWVAP